MIYLSNQLKYCGTISNADVIWEKYGHKQNVEPSFYEYGKILITDFITENKEPAPQPPAHGAAEVPDLSFIESSPDKIIMAELLQTKGDRGRFLVTPILDDGKFQVNNTKGVYRFLIGKKLNRDQIYLFFKRYMSGYKNEQTLDDYWNKLRKYIPR